MNVLIVDDEKTIRVTLGDAVEAAGYSLFSAESCHEAERILSSERIDVVVSDIRLPDGDGRRLLDFVKNRSPYTRIIFITGHAAIEDAVKAMQDGAEDYVAKPFLNEDVVARISRVARIHQLEKENQELRSRRWGISAIVGDSPQIRKVLERIVTVSSGDYTVLITGESGTGKEVVAHAIHQESPRAAHPFVPLSCAAVPESLLEDELFGHEKGAFTDAVSRRAGAFERAHRGVLFFDDIDDMPLSVQVKLLRVLEERTFYRLGGREPVSADVRLIAATKKNLAALVAEGRFREDLFYRLNVVSIDLPPLRERRVDVPLLIGEFLKRCDSTGRSVPPTTMAALSAYDWPGNVRELENAVRRAVALSPAGAQLAPEAFNPAFSAGAAPETGKAGILAEIPFKTLDEVIRDAEKAHIETALAAAGGNRTRTAEILGISRKTLWEKMLKHNISPEGAVERSGL
ncbi:MAG TPA: sigma-54-dependent Fis family transcriptional regulator [Planctomycetes bacterium]|nr:sigma-54-dependent Fis family transcriptional regulator [Planctomycetota bacterium]